MNLPSVKLMVSRGFKQDEAEKIRTRMENYRKNYPFGDKRPTHTMDCIDKIMDGNGVEDQPAGSNQKSPAFLYVNMGDTYDTTVLWVGGNFVISNAGYFYERGNYQ
jgi:hypothetical protein